MKIRSYLQNNENIHSTWIRLNFDLIDSKKPNAVFDCLIFENNEELTGERL